MDQSYVFKEVRETSLYINQLESSIVITNKKSYERIGLDGLIRSLTNEWMRDWKKEGMNGAVKERENEAVNVGV